MKKLIALVLSLFCLWGLFGCTGQSNKDVEAKEYQFQATVLDVTEEYLLVEPEEGSKAYNFSDKYRVGIKGNPSWPIPQVGDLVNVVYNGFAHASYPAEIPYPNRVEIIAATNE